MDMDEDEVQTRNVVGNKKGKRVARKIDEDTDEEAIEEEESDENEDNVKKENTRSRSNGEYCFVPCTGH
jgi:hypothetical protein